MPACVASVSGRWNRYDGADALLALDLKRTGFLASISETFAFLSKLEPVMFAVV
jgi:hypothetical protein